MIPLTFESLEDYVSRRYSLLDQLESLEGIMKPSLAQLKNFSISGLLSAVPYEQVLSHYLLTGLVANTKQYQAGANNAHAWKEDQYYSLKITIPNAPLEKAVTFLDTVYQRNFSADTPVWLLARDPNQVERRRRQTVAPSESASILQSLEKVPLHNSGLDTMDRNPEFDALSSPNMTPVRYYCNEYPQYVRTITVRSSAGVAVARINPGNGQRDYNLLVSLCSLTHNNLIDLARTAQPLFTADTAR